MSQIGLIQNNQIQQTFQDGNYNFQNQTEIIQHLQIASKIKQKTPIFHNYIFKKVDLQRILQTKSKSVCIQTRNNLINNQNSPIEQKQVIENEFLGGMQFNNKQIESDIEIQLLYNLLELLKSQNANNGNQTFNQFNQIPLSSTSTHQPNLINLGQINLSTYPFKIEQIQQLKDEDLQILGKLSDEKRKFITENLSKAKENHEIYKKLIDYKESKNFDEILKKILDPENKDDQIIRKALWPYDALFPLKEDQKNNVLQKCNQIPNFNSLIKDHLEPTKQKWSNMSHQFYQNDNHQKCHRLNLKSENFDKSCTLCLKDQQDRIDELFTTMMRGRNEENSNMDKKRQERRKKRSFLRNQKNIELEKSYQNLNQQQAQNIDSHQMIKENYNKVHSVDNNNEIDQMMPIATEQIYTNQNQNLYDRQNHHEYELIQKQNIEEPTNRIYNRDEQMRYEYGHQTMTQQQYSMYQTQNQAFMNPNINNQEYNQDFTAQHQVIHRQIYQNQDLFANQNGYQEQYYQNPFPQASNYDQNYQHFQQRDMHHNYQFNQNSKFQNQYHQQDQQRQYIDQMNQQQNMYDSHLGYQQNYVNTNGYQQKFDSQNRGLYQYQQQQDLIAQQHHQYFDRQNQIPFDQKQYDQYLQQQNNQYQQNHINQHQKYN